MTSTGPQNGSGEEPTGIFAATEYVRTPPPAREFKPWHRPRKQFVRASQWVEHTQRLLRQRTGEDPFTYLGLPGTDLLDLRVLHDEVCVPMDVMFRFLGLNSESRNNRQQEVDLNTSLDEVRKLPRVDPTSNVIADDFRSLAKTDSVAWQAARQIGPFDVVNLDLCDGLASEPPQGESTLYAAIAQLLALQERRTRPWLLLVTSRIGREHFDAEVRRCSGTCSSRT